MGPYNFGRGLIPFLVMLATLVAMSHGQGLRLGFYSSTCPIAELIVQSVVRSHFINNSAIAPGILKMHFYDCFVEGCDGSILINGPNTEKTVEPNLLLRGYEVIDDAKTQLEGACPNVVSCADILAVAARDSVVLTGGAGWNVLTGRRDGQVSLASNTFNLPRYNDSVNVQIQKFQDKGLNIQDLVTLVGGHTIGTSACQFFRYRLYNFTSTGGADPTINPEFLAMLQALCPANGDGSRQVGLDNGSETQFDNTFFRNLRDGRGVLESDQRLFSDISTRNVVQPYLGLRGLLGLTFNVEFERSMVKMSNVGVKTGTNGEIRRVCSAVN